MDGAPLLLCFPFVREAVLELLTLTDAVLLLSSCRTLREDHEAVGVVLRANSVTRHFGHRCNRDWLSPVPRFEFDYECAEDHEPTSPLGQQAASVSLLSLVGLLHSKLGLVGDDDIHSSYTVPFILPLQVSRNASSEVLRAAFNTLSEHEQLREDCELEDFDGEELGSLLFPEDDEDDKPTSSALHWENLQAEAGAEVSFVCRFCSSIQHEINQFVAEADHFCAHRDRLMVELRDQGYDPYGDAFLAAMADYDQQMRSLHVLYDQRELVRSVEEMAFILFLTDRLPPLKMVGPKSEAMAMCVAEAVQEHVSELCLTVYRPLRRIFSMNGFYHLRCVETKLYTHVDLFPTIKWVEMVGGLSPHGYFAGVFVVQVKPL